MSVAIRGGHGEGGYGLLEALLVLAINLCVITACVALCIKARDLQRTHDADARMQESARHALAVIEADLRLAGYWGLARPASTVTANPVLEFPDRCGGQAWATDAARFVDGSNNRYLTATNCSASGGGARPGADVLVVRRASARRVAQNGDTVAAPDRDRLLVASRLGAGEIFLPRTLGDQVPAGYVFAPVADAAPAAELRPLLVHAYYVSADSGLARGFPALRRKTLTAGPGVGDEEIVAGIEDLQFRIGLDTDDDANADTYAEPGLVPDGALPVTVQVWLRLRSQERDNSHGGTPPITYADRSWPAVDDGFRRLLVTKTVQLRNGRP